MKSYEKYKHHLTVLISFGIILVLIVLSSFLYVLNKSIQNSYYHVKNSFEFQNLTKQIVIVDIDDASINEFGTFPFSRDIYAQFIENISFYNPAVIALDVLFLDASPNDREFLWSIKNRSNIVFGAALNAKWDYVPPFFNGTSGYLAPNIDSSNNTVYSFSPQREIKNKKYEHFVIKILQRYYEYFWITNHVQGNYTSKNYNFSDAISYPLAQKWSKEVLIHFNNPKNFQRISLKDTLDQDTLTRIASKIDLKDKIVLLWPAAEGLNDRFFTPNGIEYGVNIHGHILSTLLSRSHMMYFDRMLEWIFIFFLVILGVSLNLQSSKKSIFIGNFLLWSIFILVFPLALIIHTSLILNYPAEILLALILSILSANIVKFIIENKNKLRLSRALSEYVGSHIADEILLEQWKVNLNGEKRTLICLFSDIEWFTKLSESLEPETLVQFLRSYLWEMTQSIMNEGGYVDKYEWDAVMALWWAFQDHSREHYIAACRSALEQQHALIGLSKKWEGVLHGKQLRIRIGIHGGKAIVGNIWAPGKKLEFTALGDNVNLASRLEGVNKYYHSYICVSEEVYQACKDIFFFRYLDTIQVVGKSIPVNIYELRGYTSDMTDKDHEFREAFATAREAYKKWNFKRAIELFWNLESDSLVQVYLERCEKFIQSPPKDWEGVWKMTEK